MAGGEEMPIRRLLWQLQNGLQTTMAHLSQDPRVAELLNTRLGQYLSCHPFLALTLMVFAVMATIPVGLFLLFAAVTLLATIFSVVLLEGVVLCLGGAALLCVLCCLAVAAFVVSAILTAFYITTSTVLHFYSHRSLEKRKSLGSLGPQLKRAQ